MWEQFSSPLSNLIGKSTHEADVQFYVCPVARTDSCDAANFIAHMFYSLRCDVSSISTGISLRIVMVYRQVWYTSEFR